MIGSFLKNQLRRDIFDCKLQLGVGDLDISDMRFSRILELIVWYLEQEHNLYISDKSGLSTYHFRHKYKGKEDEDRLWKNLLEDREFSLLACMANIYVNLKYVFPKTIVVDQKEPNMEKHFFQRLLSFERNLPNSQLDDIVREEEEIVENLSNTYKWRKLPFKVEHTAEDSTFMVQSFNHSLQHFNNTHY